MIAILLSLCLLQPAQPEPVVTVDFGGTNFVDAHVRHLAGFPVIHTLNLADTAITDVGIAEVTKLKAIENLNLGNAIGVTDAAIVHLQELKALREINLAGTRVTAAGILRLRKALPGLRIRR